MDGKGKRVQLVEKAMLLLDCFWRARKSFCLAELAAQTGWAKSTIHALLSSMTGSAPGRAGPTDGQISAGIPRLRAGLCRAGALAGPPGGRALYAEDYRAHRGVSLTSGAALRQRAAAGREHGGLRRLPSWPPPWAGGCRSTAAPRARSCWPICRRSSGQSFLRPSP